MKGSPGVGLPSSYYYSKSRTWDR